MDLTKQALHYIETVASIPSFSSYEERMHPCIRDHFAGQKKALEIDMPGNNLVYKIPGAHSSRTIALTAHIDKINHFGIRYPESLPVSRTDKYIEGAMDDSVGVGLLLALAEAAATHPFPDLLFFFSEMEESKGLKEHPELLKNKGRGHEHGMGARRISDTCLVQKIIPDEIITIDTTPLFKGDPGVALYAKHWALNNLDASEELIFKTGVAVGRFLQIDPAIKLDNNTNDYLQYGFAFNQQENAVVSLALEPAIYPYHQKEERVFIRDIQRVLDILLRYLEP